jgi:hypothetical protein
MLHDDSANCVNDADDANNDVGDAVDDAVDGDDNSDSFSVNYNFDKTIQVIILLRAQDPMQRGEIEVRFV